MTPVRDEPHSWTCDLCDFESNLDELPEDQLVSTTNQEKESSKSTGHVKLAVVDGHPEAPDRCPRCDYQGLALRIKEVTRSRAGTVRRSYYAQCRSCNHDERFYREEEPIPGTPDECPSCGGERLTIRLDAEPEPDSREYSGQARCRECENVCHFQAVED